MVMALVDFHQLAILYKLRCQDVGVLSIPPNLPQTQMVTHSTTRLKANEPARTSNPAHVGPFLVPSLPPTRPRTPEPKAAVTQSIHASAQATPNALGSSTVSKLQLDPDQRQKIDSAKYEEFLIEDFKNHRVFADIDIFMEYVLDVPADWEQKWESTIDSIKKDGGFSAAFDQYDGLCQSGTREVPLYTPLVKMANAVSRVSSSSENKSTKPVTKLRYFMNDPKKIEGGVITFGQSPDIVAVDERFLACMKDREIRNGRLDSTRLKWTQPVQMLEVKALGGALVDGSCMPRVVVNGSEYTVIPCDELS
jgi:hypothetical protein